MLTAAVNLGGVGCPAGKESIRNGGYLMQIHIEKTSIPEVILVRHEVAVDDRGSFLEAYRQDVFAEAGLPRDFPQVNLSSSHRHVVRGLHTQWNPPMGKMMAVLSGRGYLVAVDVRRNSPMLGRWFGIELSPDDRTHVWAPAGFARGFCALEDDTRLQYFCTAVYNPAGEGAIRWNDPEIGIDWPVTSPIVSARDAAAEPLLSWLETDGALALAY
jgi:dTDP-4-dehydrorhamnose 3,5-epimerase